MTETLTAAPKGRSAASMQRHCAQLLNRLPKDKEITNVRNFCAQICNHC